MKNLITLLFVFSVHSLLAKASLLETLNSYKESPETVVDLLKKDKDPTSKAFLRRLEELELIDSNSSERRRSSRDASPDEIIKLLDSDLLGPYLESATKELGKCERENCVSSEAGNRLIQAASGEKFCYPGTDCSYYKCMEEQYKCSAEGFNYFSELAYPTCSSYVQRIGAQKFTQDGVDWIYTVMVCLQKGLFEECSIKGNCNKQTRAKTCEHIVDFTLEFHPGCYLESGIGVCKLPLSDQLAIWKTVAPFLTRRETIEAFKVVYQCFFK